MLEPIRVLTVEKDDGDGLITTFTDGTTAGYVAEELLELRPQREQTDVARRTNDIIPLASFFLHGAPS
jgi:hypothetical protein